MPLGPVFRHEMLAAGRKRRYFAAAAMVGLGMLLLLAFGYAAARQEVVIWSSRSSEQPGLSIAAAARLTSLFYSTYVWATMWGVLFVTPVVAAGAIATERERRTIEYLFATDLSNSEIVLDKLAARLLTVAKLVLAGLPVLAIFRLLGGVPGSLLLMHFAMLASTATLVASLALTRGVWCDRARDAAPRALSVVFVWLIALPITLFVREQLAYSDRRWAELLAEWVVDPLIGLQTLVHPIWVLATSAGVGGRVLGVDVAAGRIATMVGLQLVAAGGLMLLCVAVVRRVHLRAASSPAGPKAPAGSAGSRARAPYERRPMLWKELFAASIKKRRRKWLRRFGVGVAAIGAAAPLTVILYSALTGGGTDFDDLNGVSTAYVTAIGSIALLVMGTRAAGLVTHERERDTWLSLLTTDLSAEEVLDAKALGNFYAHRWVLFGVTLVPLIGAVLNPLGALSAVGVLAVMLAAGWAATSIGLAFSLRMNSSIKAVGATVLTLVGLSVFYPLLASAFFAFGGARDESVALFVLPTVVPFLLGVPLWLINDHVEEVFPVAYFAGLIFYSFLGFTVSMSNAAVFNTVCQRGVGLWGPQPSTPSAARYPATGPLPPAPAGGGE